MFPITLVNDIKTSFCTLNPHDVFLPLINAMYFKNQGSKDSEGSSVQQCTAMHVMLLLEQLFCPSIKKKKQDPPPLHLRNW